METTTLDRRVFENAFFSLKFHVKTLERESITRLITVLKFVTRILDSDGTFV
jgi:hypothetical protein